MDRERALDRLPQAYARALRLRDAGTRHEEIGVQLGVPVEAVPPLLAIGEAKLRDERQRGRHGRVRK